MARATPKLLDEDATEPDAPVEEAPVPGYSIAMARARAMGEVAVDNGLRFDFSARDASRRSSFSGADNGVIAAEPAFSLAAVESAEMYNDDAPLAEDASLQRRARARALALRAIGLGADVDVGAAALAAGADCHAAVQKRDSRAALGWVWKRRFAVLRGGCLFLFKSDSDDAPSDVVELGAPVSTDPLVMAAAALGVGGGVGAAGAQRRGVCATVGLDPGERGAVRIETVEPRQLILRGAADAWSPTAWLKAFEAAGARRTDFGRSNSWGVGTLSQLLRSRREEQAGSERTASQRDSASSLTSDYLAISAALEPGAPAAAAAAVGGGIEVIDVSAPGERRSVRLTSLDDLEGGKRYETAGGTPLALAPSGDALLLGSGKSAVEVRPGARWRKAFNAVVASNRFADAGKAAAAAPSTAQEEPPAPAAAAAADRREKMLAELAAAQAELDAVHASLAEEEENVESTVDALSNVLAEEAAAAAAARAPAAAATRPPQPSSKAADALAAAGASLYSRSPDGARRVHVPAAPSPLAKRPGSAAEVMAAEVDRALVRDVSVVSLSPRAIAR